MANWKKNITSQEVTFISSDKIHQLRGIWNQTCPCCHTFKNALLDIGIPKFQIICLDCLEKLYIEAFPKEIMIEHFKKEKKELKSNIRFLQQKKKEAKDLQHFYEEKKDESENLPTQLKKQRSNHPDDVNRKSYFHFSDHNEYPAYSMIMDYMCTNCKVNSVTFGRQPGLCLTCMKELFGVIQNSREQRLKIALDENEKEKNDFECSLRQNAEKRQKLEEELAMCE